jgi:hypothetical protein
MRPLPMDPLIRMTMTKSATAYATMNASVTAKSKSPRRKVSLCNE